MIFPSDTEQDRAGIALAARIGQIVNGIRGAGASYGRACPGARRPPAVPRPAASPRRPRPRHRVRWCRAGSRPRPGAAAPPGAVVSRSSRAWMSASTSAKCAVMPRPSSSRMRRPARTSGVAVTNNFTVASGAITVPMSRPSSTAPPAWRGEIALALEQCRAHRRIGRNRRGDPDTGSLRSSGSSQSRLELVARAHRFELASRDRRPSATG